MNKVLSSINTSLKKAEVTRQRIAALVTPEVGRPITVLVKYLDEDEHGVECVFAQRRTGTIDRVRQHRVRYLYMNELNGKEEPVQAEGYIDTALLRTDRKVYGGFFAVDDRTQ